MQVWLLWVLVSTVAFGVGGLWGSALSPSDDLIVIGYLALTSSLILAAALQSLILRRLIADAGRWGVPAGAAPVGDAVAE